MAGITDTDPTDRFLAHYGVKGMKWGVRRLSKGRKSVSKSEFLAPKPVATPFPKNRPTPGVTDLSPKPIKQISDVELRNRINRIQMETQYSQLTNPKVETPDSKFKKGYQNFEKGHDAVKKIINVGKTAQSIHKLAKSDLIKDIAAMLSDD